MSVPGSYANGFAPRDGQPLYPELWRGCVGAWAPCLGPTGLTLRDWSGRANRGVLTGMDAGADWVINQGSYALDFDGSNDVVTAAVPAMNNTKCTQTYWFRRAATSVLSGFAGFGVASSVNDRFVIQPWLDGVVYVSFTGNNWGQFNSNDLSWHHVAAVFDGTKSTNAERLVVYLDGRIVSLTYSGTIPATFGSPALLRIGQTFTLLNQFGSGFVDDYAIFNRDLSANEIRLRASRRGIAYDLAPRRRSRIFTGGFRAYWAARKAQIIGGGL
jgi:hypothetical protein